MTSPTGAIGASLDRVDGPLKVRGAATYAYEQPVENAAYVYPLLSGIASGRIIGIDADAARSEPGVLDILTHLNAPKLTNDDPELSVLQSDEVNWHGQFVGAVIAETLETARYAAGLVRFEYDQRPHDVDLRFDRDDLTKPENAAFFGHGGGELQDGSPADSIMGDVEAGLRSAAVRVDQLYTMPLQLQSPMEPHTAIAVWSGDDLTIYCSSQGVSTARQVIAGTLGLDPQHLRVISPHAGGGFGSKVFPHSYAVPAALAAQLVNRPVELALTRQQMFTLVGNRSPAFSRVQLGADADGRLTTIAHDTVQQHSRQKVYAEQLAVCTRKMYAAPNRRTTHRLAALDVPPPTIMRAPGEAQGMFALESAMDELAIACGMDPVELRIRNEPDAHPESGRPFSSRKLVECLREGARLFGWEPRDPTPRARRDNGWLVGTGMACATYPSPRLPGNNARVRVTPEGHYTVALAAAEIGTGSRTALAQISADALGVPMENVELQIGDSALPAASSAGFSSGTNCWGTAIYDAARKLREVLDGEHGGVVPPEGLEVTTPISDNPNEARYAMDSYGAQFAEARVNEATGTVRVARLLGVFDAGRIINPKTARSQLIGGMTQGLSVALHEGGVVDLRFGHAVNHDLAGYHIAANADVLEMEAHWVESEDTYINPMGAKGLGEVCSVGTAAVIANAVHHATGIRIRDLPITLDKLLG
jgi:xanthine dehydrogenase YagR molybdenum-binding subunit